MGSLYNKVKVNNPGHSFFNLSNDKKFDCDMGQLIPFKTILCMPNDRIKFGNEIVARMNPLVAPVMHEINIYTQYFFVPLRIMFGQMKTHTYPGPTGTETVAEWDVNDRDLETFLTGGKTGYDTSVSLPFLDLSSYSTPISNDCAVHPVQLVDGSLTNVIPTPIAADSPIPKGIFFTIENGAAVSGVSDGTTTSPDPAYLPLYVNETVAPYGPYSLWDYLEFPVRDIIPPQDINISAFPFRAYALIWNNFFRDQTLMDEIDVINNRAVKNVCWSKDYFTSAYTELQRGQAPALPYSAILPVHFDNDPAQPGPGQLALYDTSGSSIIGFKGSSSSTHFAYDGSTISTFSGSFPFKVDAAGMFNVNDLRVAFRVQEWLETNLRVGEHLNEFLIGHFGIGPNDETLQRPVYLGGSKSPVIVSEVLQTSETTSDSPQGNLSGHGISADRNYIGSYTCKEFGIFMGVMYIRPKSNYQDGISRVWLYETKYDIPFPEFAHLGNQPIFESEIFSQVTGNVDANGNPVIFAYTERYNELRSSHSVVCGGLRDMFDFWHVGRKFSSAPNFNADFVRCVPDKRIFAVQNEPGFIVNVGNIVHAYRPLPIYGEPRT